MRKDGENADLSRVVVITGGSAGIGRATVHEFAKHGHKIAVLARDLSRLRDTKREAKELGSPETISISVDVSSAKDLEKATVLVEKALGPIDIWVNNAMATVFSPIHRITPDEFRRVTEVTYLGTVYGTLAALRRMRERNHGIIVQVGSALSYRAIPLQAPYCATKHAIRGFTDSLRTELAHDGKDIHLTMVQLPTHNTPQFSWARSHVEAHPQPVPPIFQPELAARAIYFAAFQKRREVWVGSSVVATILMNKFFPGVVDRYLALSGYASQMADKELENNKPGNLFEPVKGDYGAHGVFDKKAQEKSQQFEYEQIPVLHYFTNFVIGVVTIAGMVPGFVKKLFQTT